MKATNEPELHVAIKYKWSKYNIALWGQDHAWADILKVVCTGAEAMIEAEEQREEAQRRRASESSSSAAVVSRELSPLKRRGKSRTAG